MEKVRWGRNKRKLQNERKIKLRKKEKSTLKMKLQSHFKQLKYRINIFHFQFSNPVFKISLEISTANFFFFLN